MDIEKYCHDIMKCKISHSGLKRAAERIMLETIMEQEYVTRCTILGKGGHVQIIWVLIQYKDAILPL